MHHNHINRDGFFIDAKLTKAAAATMHNDPKFTATINGAAFATPLFVDAGVVPGLNGGKGAVFVATETNDVYALDELTGAAVWHVTAGTPASGPAVGCGNIKPQGVTGTPAIDLTTSLIVLDAATGPAGVSDHVVYGLDLATGMTKWKVPLNGTKDTAARTFNASQHLQRPAALILNGYAYFAFGGNIGDCGNYFGWVIAVSLDGNPAKTRAWRPDDTRQCGIWGPGGPSSDGQSVFVATGNGSAPSSWAGSEGVFRLGLDLSFTKNAMDYYAAPDYATLDSADRDINGSNPVLVDANGVKGLLTLGKSGTAYLVDRNNMGGVGGKLLGQSKLSGGPISNAAAVATINGTTYVVANNNSVPTPGGCSLGGGGNLFAVKIDMAAPNKMTEIWCADGGGFTSPIITTTDGTNNAIVWLAGSTNNKLNAFDLLTGMAIPNTSTLPALQHHCPSITAANGRIYAANTKGAVFALIP
jgi:outer membrane protein assembly factor BamB